MLFCLFVSFICGRKSENGPLNDSAPFTLTHRKYGHIDTHNSLENTDLE